MENTGFAGGTVVLAIIAHKRRYVWKINAFRQAGSPTVAFIDSLDCSSGTCGHLDEMTFILVDFEATRDTSKEVDSSLANPLKVQNFF